MELVCHQFAKRVYKSSFFSRVLIRKQDIPKSMLPFIARKPDLLASIRKLYLPSIDSQATIFDPMFKGAYNLSAIRFTATEVPGFMAALVSACLPLKKLYLRVIKGLYDQIDEGVIAKLKPTVVELGLIDLGFSASTIAPLFLHHIAKHLGDTLKVLFISAPEWSALKHSMKVLTRLAVDGINLDRYVNMQAGDAIAKQLAANPPSVGLNLAVALFPDKQWRTLMTTAIDQHNPGNVVKLLRSGFNMHLPIPGTNLATRPKSHVDLLFSHTGCAMAALKEADFGVWQRSKKSNRGQSIFRIVFNEYASSSGWMPLAEWIFQTKWPQALKEYTAKELLECNGTTGRGLIEQMVAAIGAYRYKERLEFLAARLEIFGDVFAKKTKNGRSHLHLPFFANDVIVLWAFKDMIPWHEPDDDGYNALESLSRTYRDRMATQIMTFLSDKEFAHYATPEVYASYQACSNDPTEWIARLIQSIPRERWQEYITHWIQTALRFARAELLNQLLVHEGAEMETICRMATVALQQPYDVARWAKFYRAQNAFHFGLPVPHLLAQHNDPDFARRVVAALRSIQTESELLAWFKTRDENGRTFDEVPEIATNRFATVLGL